MSLRLASLPASLLALTAALSAQAGSLPLIDHFNDGVLDTTKWGTLTPYSNSSVLETGGACRLTNRGILHTKAQFDASVVGPYTVWAEYDDVYGCLGCTTDAVHVVVRTDLSQVNHCCGGVDNGIDLSISASNNSVNLSQLANGAAQQITSAPFTVTPGNTVVMEITDTGSEVHAKVWEAQDRSNTVSLSLTPLHGTPLGSRIAFFNRERVFANYSVDLDRVIVSCEGKVRFSRGTSLSSSEIGATGVTTIDANGDGRLDVVSASPVGGSVTYFENLGNAVFGAGIAIQALSVAEPRDVFAADIDGDGADDLLLASRLGNSVSWFRNQGFSTFGPEQLISMSVAASRRVQAADLDGDSDMDVLAVGAGATGVHLFENLGAGNFGPAVNVGGLSAPYDVHAADLDGDGDLDITALNIWGGRVMWYENQGALSFASGVLIDVIPSPAISLHADDVDGDGDTDLLTTSEGGSEVACYFNDGTGLFSAPTIVDGSLSSAYDVRTGDIDRDGHVDVIACGFGDDTIKWYANQGNGSFAPGKTITKRAGSVLGLCVEDLDGDEDPDVLSANFADDRVMWYENRTAPRACGTPVLNLPGASPGAGGTVQAESL